MKTITCTETIHAPIDHVFAVVADMPGCAEHLSGVTRLEMLTDGPVGVGTKWTEWRVFFGKESSETMWITEFTPPTGYVAEARSHGTHYRTPITLEAVDDRTTRITFEFNAKPETLMAKVMMKLMGSMDKHIRECFAQDLTNIKSHCEASAVTTA